MTFNDKEQFENTARKVVEDATALIRKNKGVDVYLVEFETTVPYNNSYSFSYALTWPKKQRHNMSLHSMFFFNGANPTSLPLIDGPIKEGIKKLLGVVTDLEYITACVATWIYLVGKDYKYF